jgi:DNA-binding IclR family transcriptional regulator
MAQKLLEFLGNGKWHSTAQITEDIGIPIKDLHNIVKELHETRALEWNQKAEKIRLSPWVRKLPSKVRVEENKAIIASVIMPPRSTVQIQEAVITNFTESDLELGIRANDKLKQLTIQKLG